MVDRLLVAFVWLNLQISVSWQVDFQWGSCVSILSFLSWLVDFQWGSCGSICSFLGQGWRLLVGFVWLNLQFSVSWQVDFQWVRVAQYLDFCVMIGGLLVGFVWLNLLFSVSWLVDFQWASCVSFYCFLCHGRYTFSGVRVAQSLVFCVMVGRFLVGFVWLNLLFSVSWLVDFQWVRVAQSLVFCVLVGRLLVVFVWLNLQISVSCQLDFQWGSCFSIFSFLGHGWQTFNGVRAAQSLVFCVMVDRLLVEFVWLNLQSSVSWQVVFQWGSCVSIFSFLCHGWQTFSGVRVAQSLVFCVMVGRLLVGFVRLNLQFSVSRLATFSGVRVAQSLFFCLMVGGLLVGFVWLNIQISVS